MMNVYESVRKFFEEDFTAPPVIAREWVEGYLRQKAWTGASDKELHEIWLHLRSLQEYLFYTHYQALDELTAEDYAEALQWMKLHSNDIKINLRSVRRFFAVLEDFFQYLVSRKLCGENDQIKLAAEKIAGGNKLNLQAFRLEDMPEPEPGKAVMPLSLDFMQAAGLIPGTIEKLMLKIGWYFQNEAYDEDFHRALYLYVGPMQSIPAVEDEGFFDFWMGFWDYFLFDYHLLQDDLTPVKHYLQAKNRLPKVERTLLENLSSARFCIFYIQKIIDGNWVECVNLLTDEVFRMPYPDFDYKLMKRLLFFGHIFAGGAFIANYIASLEISVNLRQRLKQELSRLKTLYAIQQPDADWDSFIGRHCLAIRHTITLLTTFAKLNVIALPEAYAHIAKPETVRCPDPRVIEELSQLMPKYGFSIHDVQLAERMWHDFCQINNTSIRKSGAWTSAVISCYGLLNTPFAISVDDLAKDTGVSTASIYANRRRLMESLAIRPHDPRYLSEEGVVLLLYSS